MENNKDAVILAVFLVSLVTLILITINIIWTPVSFYLDEWDDYWREKSYDNSQESWVSTNQRHYWAALDVCEKKIGKSLGNEEFITSATSTDDYKTYDCLYLKYTKLPN